MKFILTLIICYYSSTSLFAQSCDFQIREISQQFEYTLAEIDSCEFNNVPKLVANKIESKTEEYYLKEYPEYFNKEGYCYSFESLNSHKIEACGLDSTLEMKAQTNYEFIGQYCNSAIIKVSGYEYWGFITVNLNNGLGFYTLGQPITFNCTNAISSDNYYGEEEISISDLSSTNLITIGINEWYTVQIKYEDDEFYLKLKNSNYRCEDQFKYLKIHPN